VTLAVLRGVDVLVMVLILTALVGMYAARRYARAELIYGRRPERPSRSQSPRPEPDETGDAAIPPGWAEPRDPTVAALRARAKPLTSGNAARAGLPGRTHAQKASRSGVAR
jgi:hypothetical protein